MYHSIASYYGPSQVHFYANGRGYSWCNTTHFTNFDIRMMNCLENPCYCMLPTLKLWKKNHPVWNLLDTYGVPILLYGNCSASSFWAIRRCIRETHIIKKSKRNRRIIIHEHVLDLVLFPWQSYLITNAREKYTFFSESILCLPCIFYAPCSRFYIEWITFGYTKMESYRKLLRLIGEARGLLIISLSQ